MCIGHRESASGNGPLYNLPAHHLFEDLLDVVSETAQGDEFVDACLASETGKVYLAIAQAAGRLET